MIAKGNTHNDPARLARYLTSGKAGEYAELWELRGFASRDMVEAFRAVDLIAAATRCRQPFMHVQVRNPDGETLARAQWQIVVDRIERSLGLAGQPRAIAVHVDRRTGHEHLHLAFSRIDEKTLKARPLPFFKVRLKQISRELEIELGLTRVRNERASVIRYAPTPRENAQAQRLEVDIHAVREIIRNCFDQSDCGPTFRAALAENDLVLAQGERRDFVVMDRAGGIHALGKRILGVSAAEIRVRLADLRRDELPTVAQARRSRTPGSPVPSLSARKVSFDGLEIPMNAASSGYSSAVSDTPETSCTYSEAARAVGKETSQAAVAASPAPVVTTTPTYDAEITPDTPLNSSAVGPYKPAPLIETAAVTEAAISTLEPAAIRDQCGENADLAHLPRTGEALREKFRSLVKHLTGKPTMPSPRPRRRRREEGARSFKAFAITLLRRVSRTPVFDPMDLSWNAFTWLHFWEYNHAASLSQDCAVAPPSSVPQL